MTYKLQNFVSDIGGLAGLFLGFSLLSLFEIILKAVVITKNFFENKASRKIVKVSATEQPIKKSRRRIINRTLKKRNKISHGNAASDLVVIDLVFGEHIEGRF